MSSVPSSAFDILMSNARRAAKKRKLGETLDSKFNQVKLDQLKSKIGLLKKKPCDFYPEEVSCWEKGERVPFMFLSLAFDLMYPVTPGIVVSYILCNMLRTVLVTTPEDLVPTLYLASNQIAPDHEGLELRIDDGFIIKAISEAFGRPEAQVKMQSTEVRDLALVAQGSHWPRRMEFKHEPLTVFKVFNTFQQIAKETGEDSAVKKINLIKELRVATKDCEPSYLTNLVQEKFRLGFTSQIILSALGRAAVLNEKHSKPHPNIKNPLDEAAKNVRHIFTVIPVYDIIVPALLTGGVWNLHKTCNFTLGVPISPMRAKPVRSVGAIFDKFKDTAFTCEYNYGGERAQIHYMEDGRIEIFSLGQRNTEKYPDVVLAISRLKKPSVRSFILDCNIVAFDREENKILPNQILVTQARKVVNVNDIKDYVCIFAFDMLYLNGQLLIQENLNIRREKLYDSFEEDPGHFRFATAITSTDINKIQAFRDASVEIGCGSVIIKTLSSDATYQPGERSDNWLSLTNYYI